MCYDFLSACDIPPDPSPSLDAEIPVKLEAKPHSPASFPLYDPHFQQATPTLCRHQGNVHLLVAVVKSCRAILLPFSDTMTTSMPRSHTILSDNSPASLPSSAQQCQESDPSVRIRLFTVSTAPPFETTATIEGNPPANHSQKPSIRSKHNTSPHNTPLRSFVAKKGNPNNLPSSPQLQENPCLHECHGNLQDCLPHIESPLGRHRR